MSSTRDLSGLPDRDGAGSSPVRIPRQASRPEPDAERGRDAGPGREPRQGRHARPGRRSGARGPAAQPVPPLSRPAAGDPSERALLDRILRERPLPPTPAAPGGRPASDAPATGSPAGPPARTGRPRRPDLLLVLPAATAAVLTAAGVVALGAAAHTASRPSGAAEPASAVAPAVIGTGGIVPGDAPVTVRVPLPGPAGRRLAVTAVRPGPSSLPASCPASVWDVAPRSRTLAGGPDARLAVAVALRADAPSGCQGFTAALPVTVTARAPDGDTVRLATAVPVTVARLGTPAVTFRAAEGRLAVVGVAATDGPAPTSFTVDAVAPDGSRTPVCRAHTLKACVDTAAGPAAERRYELTAWRGAWRVVAAPVTAWAPPPAPRLDVSAGPRVRVRADRAAGDWTLRVRVDGTTTTDLTVRAGADLDGDLPLGALRPGPHHVQVVAGTHGQERVAEVQLTVRDAATGR